MKKHDFTYYIGLAMTGIPVLVWALVLGDPLTDAAGLVIFGCMAVGVLLMTYGDAIDPHMHFMYKGSFLRTIWITVKVSAVGWLLVLGVYWLYRLVTSL